MIDLHVHTWRCRHAEGTAEEYVKSAAKRGVQVLAFTEHLPLSAELAARVPGAEGYAMPLEELPDYVEDVRRAAALGMELGVDVLLGIEVDAVPAGLTDAASLLGAYPFDIVLGAVHFIDDWAFDDPEHTERYTEWSIDDLWERYFSDLTTAARTGLVDVVAHIDLVKKFCFRPHGSLEALYSRTARALAQAQVAVEVNTAGLRKPCREIYPSQPLLAALRHAGVAVTIGSDAHCPEEVGAGMPEALATLREAGYRSALVFRNRQPQEVGLDDL
ncbi:MAG: histidinol-phosphatase HisJ family protein [Coriobacteriia bacterium]|nr:histidinol-phosphatase HisJ family protein [Coriobacteriia bacterium]